MVTVDVDECAEGTDGCAQSCTDTDGSYICSCDVGYELVNDRHGCDGNKIREKLMSITEWLCFSTNCIQISMNVQVVEATGVLTTAPILLERTCVAATQATSSLKRAQVLTSLKTVQAITQMAQVIKWTAQALAQSIRSVNNVMVS